MDIDGPILRDLRRLQKRERKSLGRLVSDLLARALSAGRPARRSAEGFEWEARKMGLRVDLTDKEAVRRALEGRG